VRVVLDTNILVRELLLMVSSAPYTLILSPPVLPEKRRMLRYPHVHSRWPLTNDAIEIDLGLLEAAAVMVELPPEIPAIVKDPAADPILQTAIQGRAPRARHKIHGRYRPQARTDGGRIGLPSAIASSIPRWNHPRKSTVHRFVAKP
jgi:hypothetical protein